MSTARTRSSWPPGLACLVARRCPHPDGRAITDTLFGSIRFYPLDDDVARVLIPDARDAAWSADGKRFAFVRNSER
jgi:hypothetical protein